MTKTRKVSKKQAARPSCWNKDVAILYYRMLVAEEQCKLLMHALVEALGDGAAKRLLSRLGWKKLQTKARR